MESTLLQASHLHNKTKNWPFRLLFLFNCSKYHFGISYDLNRFLLQFRNTFRILLLMAAIICFVIFVLDTKRKNELYMAIVLFLILLIMCFISYCEQTKTLKVLKVFYSIY